MSMAQEPVLEDENTIVFCKRPWRLLGAGVAALIALAEAEGAKLLRQHATGFRIEAGRLCH